VADISDCVQNGGALIDALTTVLRNVTKEETVQYVLALLDNIVTSESLHLMLDCCHTNMACSCSVNGICSVVTICQTSAELSWITRS